MIPIKLELRNFMAYRECDPLDFTGLHTVVLTGANGAGKSTLLDAIAWALWGQARARREEELIAQGESEMRVALTFSEGQHTYQAVRTRKIGKATGKRAMPTSSGSLDLLISDNGSWRTLTEGRIADTQAKIISLLNLGYETFINSAYLKQGRADEFAIKTPAERKALLGEILNLDAWQAYDARAKERLDKIERDEAIRAIELQRAEEEMARLPAYELELAEAQAALEKSGLDVARLEARANELARMQERRRLLAAQLAQTEARIATADRDLASLETQRAAHGAALQGFQRALADRATIEDGNAELEAAVALNEEFQRKLASLVELNARKTAHEHVIADARRALQSRRDDVVRTLASLREDARQVDLLPRADALRAESAGLDALRAERDALQQEHIRARESAATRKAENDQLRREMNELKARIDALATVAAICPTCGRPLDESTRERLLEELRTKGKLMGDQFRSNGDQIEQAGAQRLAGEARVQGMDATLARTPSLLREIAAADEALLRAASATERLPAATLALDELDRVLASSTYALPAQDGLRQVLAELDALGYDSAAHRQLQSVTLPRLQPFSTRKQQLDRAELGLISEQRAIDALLAQAVNVGRVRDDGRAEADSRKAEIAGLDAELRAGEPVAGQLQAARGAMFAAQRKVGEANQKVHACRSLESTCALLRAELGDLKSSRGLLRELRDAFGRNGVPAMIIEVVLPELEYNANLLLQRMTSHMAVKFETQRLTRANDVSETLDIRIRDELGERPYEMFSGGEAFRINFAVRIALSQLLARRQGARLQTLFVDEGFGTQDAQGRERLVEAIRAIEADFERIFVITHIDELKDAFPARIEVSKTASGSTAVIV